MESRTLIISTLSKVEAQPVLEVFKGCDVIYTEDYNVQNCKGCMSCWVITPGKCAIKDDYEEIFKAFVKAQQVIFVTEAKLGFVSYKMKNIVDRLIALGVAYTCIKEGEARHRSRYNKEWKIGLICKGEANLNYLNEWMARFALNFHSKSLGAFKIEDMEGLMYEVNLI